MNLRCIYCQTPFTLARGEMLTAIVQMNDKNMNHYDAHCPRCRRANSISRQRMELFFPNWQEAAKQAPSASAATSPGGGVSSTQKTEPLPRGLKSAAAIKRPSAKPVTKTATSSPKGKKPAAKKPAAGKKTATKARPAGKKAPAKGKKKK
jgi:hypothetical protein